MATRGFGVAGAVDHRIIVDLAASAERLGWDEFWVNDTPNGDGLAALAAAAKVTERIHLGVGVIPVDRVPVDRIAERLADLKLPLDRIILGIGSGGVRTGAIAMMRGAVTELRQKNGARVFLGALGPAMTQLSGEVADGVLLNWLTPEQAAASGASIRSIAAEAGRPMPTIAAYVRVAQPSGRERLADEANRYASFPQYAAHFARMGVTALETTVSGDGPEIKEGLARFDGHVDSVILRAIVANEAVEQYRSLLDAASGRLQT